MFLKLHSANQSSRDTRSSSQYSVLASERRRRFSGSRQAIYENIFIQSIKNRKLLNRVMIKRLFQAGTSHAFPRDFLFSRDLFYKLTPVGKVTN